MAAASILLPNGDYLPAQSFSQDGHTTKAQEIVICDASGNVVGATSNRLDVNVGAALPAGTNNIGDVDVLTLPNVKLAQSAAATDTITGGLQSGKAALDVTGYSTVTVMVSGTYAGVTLAVAGSNDAGSTVFTLPARDLQTGVMRFVTTLPTNGTRLYQVDVAGLNYMSVGSGSYKSGTVNVRTVASTSPSGLAASAGQPFDSARTVLSYYAVAAAAGTTTTETAITLTRSSGTSATSTASGFAVTSGKRFRITHLSVATRGHATGTIQTTTFNLRVDAAGSGITTSTTPIVFAARSACAAVNSAWDRVVIPIPDGYEIVAPASFGFTAAATYTTNAPTWDVNILGYEY